MAIYLICQLLASLLAVQISQGFYLNISVFSFLGMMGFTFKMLSTILGLRSHIRLYSISKSYL